MATTQRHNCSLGKKTEVTGNWEPGLHLSQHSTVKAIFAACSPTDASEHYSSTWCWISFPEGWIKGAQPCECQILAALVVCWHTFFSLRDHNLFHYKKLLFVVWVVAVDTTLVASDKDWTIWMSQKCRVAARGSSSGASAFFLNAHMCIF